MSAKYEMKISKPFMTIAEAAKVTGISQYYIRNGCKDGSIPHIKSGRTYLVCVPKMLEQLTILSCGGVDDGEKDC